MSLVTVCVLTYNPDWTKFRNTLKSIICQKGVDFDIVISDDGSKENCFDKAEEYLKANNFFAYRFVANQQNQGTVKNTVSALQNVESKYVKLISPGDFLYDENVLAEFVDFAEKNPAAAYFGNAVYYSVDSNDVVKIHADKYDPWDLAPWIENNYKKIRRNYFYRRNYILGASVFCQRKYLYDYLNLLKDIIKYTEDMFLMYGIANGDNILYVDKNIVFYEYGSGLSANHQTVVNEDIVNIHKYLRYGNKISLIEFLLGTTQSFFPRLVLKLLIDPHGLVCWLFRKDKKQNEKNVLDKLKTFLK